MDSLFGTTNYTKNNLHKYCSKKTHGTPIVCVWYVTKIFVSDVITYKANTPTHINFLTNEQLLGQISA